jgi:S1-C subfamily serine protease
MIQRTVIQIVLTTAIAFRFATPLLSVEPAPRSITINNVTYENVRWGSVTARTVTFFHKTGVAVVNIDQLPPEYRDQLLQSVPPSDATETRNETKPAAPEQTVASAESKPSETSNAEKTGDITAMSLIEVTRQTRPSVVLLVIKDAFGRDLGTGSGFLASPDGKIVTNYHVVEKGVSAVARTIDGKSYPVLGVLAVDKANDLAVLQIEGNDFPHVEFSEDGIPNQGTQVAVIGSPLGLEGSLSEGIVSAIRGSNGQNYWLQITAAISPGSSGSPVLDSNGRVVGVAVAQLANGQGINFAVAGQHAEDLLFDAELADGPQSLASLNRQTLGDIRQDVDYQQYLTLFINNQYKEAAVILQTLLERYPHSALGYRELGDVYWSLGRYADSAEAYRRAVTLNPQYQAAWRELGESYEEMLSYPKAIAAYREAIKIDSSDAGIWHSLGRALSHEEQYFEAVGALRKSIQIRPSNGIVWSDLGHAYLKLNKIQDAASALREAIRLEPDEPVAWYRLGLAYNGMGRFSDEISAYERAVKLRADFVDAWHNLSVAYAKSRQYEKAWEAIRQLEPIDSHRARTLTDYLTSLSPKAAEARIDNGR